MTDVSQLPEFLYDALISGKTITAIAKEYNISTSYVRTLINRHPGAAELIKQTKKEVLEMSEFTLSTFAAELIDKWRDMIARAAEKSKTGFPPITTMVQASNSVEKLARTLGTLKSKLADVDVPDANIMDVLFDRVPEQQDAQA
jgi:predicted transcriptional regulator